MPGLEKELENVSRNVSSLSKSGDVFAEQEDQIADQISSMKQRSVQYSTVQYSVIQNSTVPDIRPDLTHRDLCQQSSMSPKILMYL